MRVRSYISCIAATILLAAAACGGDAGTSSTAPGGGGQTGGASNAVTVNNNFFSPSSTSVTVGTTVTWTWSSDAVTHNVTFDDGAASGDKSAGSSYSRTFNTAGTFAYQCTIHPGMTGSITVH